MVERRIVSGDEVRAIAQLPPREQLIRLVAGSLTAGLAGIVGALGALLRDLALLIEEVARTRAGDGADPSEDSGVS